MGAHGHLVDQAEYDRAATRWFDTHLRTRPGPARSLAAATFPRVQLFDQGAEPGWRGYERWLPDGAPLALRLCPTGAPPAGPWATGGTLSSGPCSGTAAVPATPPELTGGTSIATTGESTDQDQRLAPYMAGFVGEPLTQPLTLTGPLAVRFTARTYGADADWTARIVDVAADGSSRLVARGWLKASHRRESTAQPGLYHSHVDPVLLTPGEPYELAIEVWPTAYRLAAGHRLGVLLGTSDAQKLAPTNESAASEIVASPEAPATLTATRRTDPGAPVKAPFDAKLPTAPATDDEPCRPSFARARLRVRADGAHAGFRGAGPLVAETRDTAGGWPLAAPCAPATSPGTAADLTTSGPRPATTSPADRARTAPVSTTRRIALRLARGGALRNGPRLEREPELRAAARAERRPALVRRPARDSEPTRCAARPGCASRRSSGAASSAARASGCAAQGRIASWSAARRRAAHLPDAGAPRRAAHRGNCAVDIELPSATSRRWDACGVPWSPELFSTPALQQVLDKYRLERPPVGAVLRRPADVGEVDALVESFAGEPELHHPVRGRVKGRRRVPALRHRR